MKLSLPLVFSRIRFDMLSPMEGLIRSLTVVIGEKGRRNEKTRTACRRVVVGRLMLLSLIS